VFINGDDFDTIQIVRGKPELPAEEANAPPATCPPIPISGYSPSGITVPHVSYNARNVSPTVAPASTATALICAS